MISEGGMIETTLHEGEEATLVVAHNRRDSLYVFILEGVAEVMNEYLSNVQSILRSLSYSHNDSRHLQSDL